MTLLSYSTRGAAVLEYGITAGLISVLAIGAVLATGGKVEETFCRATETLSNSIGGSYSCGLGVSGMEENGSTPSTPPYTPTDPDIILTYQGSNARIMLEGVPSGTMIDWGDGTIEAATNGINNHSFPSSDTYEVTIDSGVAQIGSNAPNCDHAPENLVSVDSFGTSGSLTSLRCAFFESTSLAYVAPIPPSVTTLERVFSGSTVSPSGLEIWNTSNVTNYSRAFYDASSFNGAIGSWDVSSGTDFSHMFFRASAFNQPLNAWDMSSAETLSRMFVNADSFNQDLDEWNTSSVTNSSYMFSYTDSFDGNVSGWDLSNVTSLKSMFQSAEQFTGSGIGTWIVSSVEDFEEMFRDADAFSADLSGWSLTTSEPVNMRQMFQGADVFNGNISTWDTSAVTNMQYMFRQAPAMDQDISSWCVENVSSYTNFSFGTSAAWTGSEKPDFAGGGSCSP